VDELLKATAEYPVSVYALPQTDTCKEVVDGMVRRTIPRDLLVIARGPWVFDRQALAGALSQLIGRESGIGSLLQLCEVSRLRVRVAVRP
jgi:2-C-methyl-D-erythritol 4-phosphate cytidylyltransferase